MNGHILSWLSLTANTSLCQKGRKYKYNFLDGEEPFTVLSSLSYFYRRQRLAHGLQEICFLYLVTPVLPQRLGERISRTGSVNGTFQRAISRGQVNGLFVQRHLWCKSVWVEQLLFSESLGC